MAKQCTAATSRTSTTDNPMSATAGNAKPDHKMSRTACTLSLPEQAPTAGPKTILGSTVINSQRLCCLESSHARRSETVLPYIYGKTVSEAELFQSSGPKVGFWELRRAREQCVSRANEQRAVMEEVMTTRRTEGQRCTAPAIGSDGDCVDPHVHWKRKEWCPGLLLLASCPWPLPLFPCP